MKVKERIIGTSNWFINDILIKSEPIKETYIKDSIWKFIFSLPIILLVACFSFSVIVGMLVYGKTEFGSAINFIFAGSTMRQIYTMIMTEIKR